MGESALSIPDPLGGEPDFESALFHRRIEFQLATRPFNGFGSGNSDGFKLVTLNPNAETNKGAGAGSGKNREKIELFEAGFDPDLSFRITFRRIGAGLRNLGNTCFLNAVLQCLTYTEPLAAYLQSGKHQNSCRKAGFCALCAIQKHVSRALQSTGRILEPKDLVSNLRCISRSFRNARQEDAHEYMVNLLESMHKCCLPSGVPSESPSAYEKSLVHRIFGGRLRSQVKCMQCSFCSNKFDPFLDLSLEIVNADSLIKALAHFTAKEHLDGGAKVYQCDHCKQKVKAIKQLSVHKAPHVLTIHLKRFSSHLEGQKIVKKVSFGPTLNMRPFVTGPYDGDLNYTLYGVLVHAGWSTHSGHYYCYVRTSSGMWYSLDDNQVVQVNERTVLEQKAYMLFYVRDRTTFSAKKSVDIVKKENMVLNAFGGAASSKFNVDFTGKIQNVSIEKKPGEAFPASMAPTVQVLSSPSTKELSVDVNVPVADCKDLGHGRHAEHSSGTALAENNSKDHSLLPSIGNVQVPPMENDLMHYSSLPNRSVNGQVAPVVDNLKDHSSLPKHSANGQVPPRENNLMDRSSLSNSSGNCRVSPGENNLIDHSSQSNSSGNGQVPREINLKDHSSLPKSSGNGQVPPTENNMKDHSSLPKSSGNGRVPPRENNLMDRSSLPKSGGNGQVPPTDNTVKYHSSLPKSSGNGQVPPTENNMKDHSSLPKSGGNGQVPPTENTVKDHSSLPKCSGNGQVPPTENTVKDHSSLPKSSGNGQVPPTDNTVKYHSSLPKSSRSFQVGGPSGNTAADSTLLETHEHGIKGSQNVACGVKTNKKNRLKVRRKLLKYHIAANSLSSVMMFSAVRRTEKKNQKLRKRHSMQKKDLNRKVLLARSGESSVSESSLPTVVGNAPSQKKNAESCSVGNNQSLSLHAVTADSINGSMNPEFKGRTVPDDPSILAENPTARSPCGTTFSAENPTFPLESRQANNAMSRLTRELPEAEVMSMLTRDKTIVAHWDGIDVSPAEQVETPAAGPLQLGYIGDEWDEDYDRGKRKKVRDPKPEFDGRNFFQEHSTRNHQMKRAKSNQTRNLGMKRAKVNRSGSENYPFRI